MYSLKENWETVKQKVKTDYYISEIQYNTWLSNLELYEETDNQVTILIPSDKDMLFDYIVKKFYDFFKIAMTEISNREIEVKFILNRDLQQISSNNNQTKPNTDTLPLIKSDTNLIENYKFDTFVVGNNNRLAYAAALAVADSPGTVYNPLFLYSKPGLGKTHLMNSIAHYILDNNKDMKVCYITAEDFTDEIIQNMSKGEGGNAEASFQIMRQKYRNMDVFMIDDIQSIIGKERSQEEFFNAFNALHSNGKQIVISSDKPPKDMETLDERFRTRFEWGLTADIQFPDFETRKAILYKYMQIKNKTLDDDIIDYIAENITTSIRELQGAFNKVIAYQSLYNEKFDDSSLEMAKEALKDTISEDSNKITLEIIMQTICSYFNITWEDLKSTSRQQKIAYPRQLYMYIAQNMTDYSQQTIADFIGRDHSTVIHGCEKISKLIDKRDSKTISDLESLKRKLSLN